MKELDAFRNFLKENESNDLEVKYLPSYYENEEADEYFYFEKGLADDFHMEDGKKVKYIVGYFDTDNGEEDMDTIGYIYSKSGKDIETDYTEEQLLDAFYDSLGSND